jgi:acyl-CoA ligase (AMP-forming) (exosortase A-associated)
MIYTLRDMLLSCENGTRSTRIAVVDGTQRVTYGDLLSRVKRFAGYLQHCGIREGDRVTIYLERSTDAVVSLFSTWFAGGVAVFINDVLKTRQVNHIIEHSEASLLITRAALLNGLEHVGLGQKSIFLWDGHQEGDGNEWRRNPLIGNDLAMLIYTSGSTGLPKGIMLSHANLVSGAQIVSDYLKITERDIVISLLPFSFDYGLNQLLASVCAGATLVLQRSLMPADICRALLDHNVTGLACVPMLWQQLAHERSSFTKTSFPDLRYLTNTGGRMPESLTRMFRKAHPQVQIYLMYGLTEAFRSTYLPPEEVERRPTSIGKAIPNNEILVIDQDGKECGADEIGELVHRGSTVSLGYWKDPEETRKKFRPLPAWTARGGLDEIAVYSGDFVKKDADGYLYFIGRKDSMIKSHGMRVSPDEIEDCIFASRMVRHAVAFATEKNEGEGEIVAAVVPLDPSCFSSNDLMRFCKNEMPDYLRPTIVWPCEGFPETSSGKPDRVQLKQDYLSHLASSSIEQQKATFGM